GFSGIQPTGSRDACRRKPAGAVARWPTRAGSRNHERFAGPGGRGPPDAGEHRSHRRRGRTLRQWADFPVDRPAAGSRSAGADAGPDAGEDNGEERGCSGAGGCCRNGGLAVFGRGVFDGRHSDATGGRDAGGGPAGGRKAERRRPAPRGGVCGGTGGGAPGRWGGSAAPAAGRTRAECQRPHDPAGRQPARPVDEPGRGLVLARNQILQFANNTEESGLLATSQRLNLITSELQEGVMKTRMQPIGNIWSKFPRTVRDLALDCGKQVRVEMEGKETELDKTLIEAIKDPLTHLVRNAVDHGIERPEVRQAAGKDPEGRLFLRAFHEGGQVNIEISDDGAGLDQARIRNKAVQKGLISADQAGRLTDHEIVNLVFQPGFSTAEKVTNVSGRGGGMDVVKTHIEKIGGTVDLQSKAGQGVTVRMKIPLTLAIIPALIVTSAGERYAVPQVNLLELVGLEGEQARKGIETIHGVPVYRLRGRLLPLVHLKSTLQTTEEVKKETRRESSPEPAAQLGSAAATAIRPGRVNIVVLEANGRHFGLVVDEINDTEEIVVKPLGKHLKHITVYSGATIMGDGKVALILDVIGLAQPANLLGEGRERILGEEVEATAEGANGKQQLVLFTGPADSRMAVPLNLLARLENIPGTQVERSGNQWVTQYRGQILPLIRVSHALEERRHRPSADDVLSLPTTAQLQVLVLENEHQSFGLVVNQILDIVESTLQPQSPATRAGVLHSSVIAERVTELLDVPALLRAGEAYEPAVSQPAES